MSVQYSVQAPPNFSLTSDCFTKRNDLFWYVKIENGEKIKKILCATSSVSYRSAQFWHCCCHQVASVTSNSVTPWTVAHQAPLPMGFCRQECWSGLLCPSAGDLPKPGIKPMFLVSPALAGGFFTTGTTGEALILTLPWDRMNSAG